MLKGNTMKAVYLLKLVLVSFLFASHSGYATQDEVSAPIGSWVIEKPHPSGAMIKIDMTIKENHEFSGVMRSNGVVAWEFSGSWIFSGNEMTYTYIESSRPLPANFKDTDVVLVVNDLVYKNVSKLTGNTNIYTRVK